MELGPPWVQEGFPALFFSGVSEPGWYLQQGLTGISSQLPSGSFHKPLCVAEPPALGMNARVVAWPLGRYLLPFKGRILALMLCPPHLQLFHVG